GPTTWERPRPRSIMGEAKRQPSMNGYLPLGKLPTQHTLLANPRSYSSQTVASAHELPKPTRTSLNILAATTSGFRQNRAWLRRALVPVYCLTFANSRRHNC